MQIISLDSATKAWAHFDKIDAYCQSNWTQSRFSMVVAAFDLVRVSWLLVKQGVQDCWQHHAITAETCQSFKEAGKYLFLAICALSIGIIVPAFVVSLGRRLIPIPRVVQPEVLKAAS